MKDGGRVFGIVAAVLLVAAATPACVWAAGALAVSPARVKAPEDFSSIYRGYWWDFDDETHFSVEGTRKGWSNPAIDGGWWTGISTARDATVRFSQLHIDGPEPTNWEPSENRYTPLDPAYRYLSVRMCAGADSRMMVRWHRNLSFADLDYGGTVLLGVRGGCEVYSVDLVAQRNANLKAKMPWNQTEPTFYALEFLPVNDAGIEVSIDYATLSTSPTGAATTISWDPADGPVDLFFSSSPTGERPTPIALNRSGSSYRWETPNLAPGTYYLIGYGQSGQQLAAAVLDVDAPPRGTLLAPSYTSGPDYATKEIGNPWNMGASGDLDLARQVSAMSFANGVYSATSLAAPNAGNPSNTGDPGLFLNVPTPIDSKKYRYLTYRMWVEGDGVLEGTGGVARVFWYNSTSLLPGTFTFTQDIRVYKGWRTVSIDLAGAFLEAASRIGAWGRYPVTNLRLDPHESAAPRRFKIDKVTLTGENVAISTYRVRYLAQDAEDVTPVVEFFTSQSRSPKGAVPFLCPEDPPPPTGATRSCLWDTSALPLGGHFVHMRLTDSAGNRTWVTSDLPVVRK
ncbi:MAG TPA: hypothetical protein VN317_04285 [Candidatus Methanoperedens sp.]|nr:hypothetical protein [Candidatus Methanoperedens sp.]